MVVTLILTKASITLEQKIWLDGHQLDIYVIAVVIHTDLKNIIKTKTKYIKSFFSTKEYFL
jgi:hypothetical protein